LASFISILVERLGELAMEAGQGGGLRAICIHVLDNVLVLERQLCRQVTMTVGAAALHIVCVCFSEEVPHDIGSYFFRSYGIW
jgi:hypothetical protein